MLISLAQDIWVINPESKPSYAYCNCMYIEDDSPTVIDLGAGARAFAALDCDRIKLALLSHFHLTIYMVTAYLKIASMAGYESATW